MKKARSIKIAILSAFAGVTILGFQNCARTEFREATDGVGASLSVSDVGASLISENEFVRQDELIPEIPLALPEPEKQPEQQPEAVVNNESEESPVAVERESGEDSLIAGTMPMMEEEPKAPSAEKSEEPETEVAKMPDTQSAPAPEVQQEPSQSETPQVATEEEAKKPVENVVDVAEGEQVQEENLVECDMGRANSKIILNSFLKTSPSNASATRVCMSENACLKIINAFAAKRDCVMSGPVVGDSEKQCTDIFPGSHGTCKNAAKVSDAQVSQILQSME